MITDPVSAAGLTVRAVHSGERGGVPTKIVIARRTYATDPADLWDALTSPERIPRWFLPVSGSLEVGGRYQLAGNAGGVVERCAPPESFAVTWEMGPTVSWLQITLTKDDAGTRLELVHEAPVDPSFWEQYGPGAVGVGWDLALLGLGLHLSTGAAVDPAEGMGFPATEVGRTFVRLATTSWGEAAIQDGDDGAAAQAAADGTFAFYTTMPES